MGNSLLEEPGGGACVLEADWQAIPAAGGGIGFSVLVPPLRNWPTEVYRGHLIRLHVSQMTGLWALSLGDRRGCPPSYSLFLHLSEGPGALGSAGLPKAVSGLLFIWAQDPACPSGMQGEAWLLSPEFFPCSRIRRLRRVLEPQHVEVNINPWAYAYVEMQGSTRQGTKHVRHGVAPQCCSDSSVFAQLCLHSTPRSYCSLRAPNFPKDYSQIHLCRYILYNWTCNHIYLYVFVFANTF